MIYRVEFKSPVKAESLITDESIMEAAITIDIIARIQAFLNAGMAN